MFRRNLGKINGFPVRVAWGVLAAILLVSPQASSGTAGTGWNGTIAAKGGKPETAAGLAKLYDSGPCAECHREVYEQWRNSAHAASFFDGGATASALRKFVHDGLLRWPSSGVKVPGDVKVEHLAACAKCHLPQLADASDGVAREIVATIDAWKSAVDGNDPKARDQAAEKLSGLNIGCLVCHNRNAVIHKLVDGYPVAEAVYGKKEGTHPGAFALLKKGEALGESIFCGQCHGYGPNFDSDNPVQCATAYGSYLFSYVRGGGKETCQDCHMRKGRMGHGIRGGGDPVMDNAALELVADAYGYLWRDVNLYVPRVVVVVTLTGRAGHAIPDGPADSRRLVLEVIGTGGDNNAPLFRETRTFRTLARRFGRSGQAGTGPHENGGIVEDTSLQPFRAAKERFDYVLKPGEIGGGKVSVLVRVRRETDGMPGSDPRVLREFRKEIRLETAP